MSFSCTKFKNRAVLRRRRRSYQKKKKKRRQLIGDGQVSHRRGKKGLKKTQEKASYRQAMSSYSIKKGLAWTRKKVGSEGRYMQLDKRNSASQSLHCHSKQEEDMKEYRKKRWYK